jgi:protein-disulfide isomerase
MKRLKMSARIFIVLLLLPFGLEACGDLTNTAVPSTATAIPATATTLPTKAPATTQAATTATLEGAFQFKLLPATSTLDSGLMTIGSQQAQVTLTKYTDFRCPVCKRNFDQAEQLLLNQYVSTGKIKFTLQTFPVIDMIRKDSESQLGGQALLCAADQRRSWDYHDLAYNNFVGEVGGKLTASYLKQMAQALRLDTSQFNTCLDSGKYSQTIVDQTDAARKLGVSGTPTFSITYQGQERLIKGNTFEILKAELDKTLQAVA